jgi:hypothetical protein
MDNAFCASIQGNDRSLRDLNECATLLLHPMVERPLDGSSRDTRPTPEMTMTVSSTAGRRAFRFALADATRWSSRARSWHRREQYVRRRLGRISGAATGYLR